MKTSWVLLGITIVGFPIATALGCMAAIVTISYTSWKWYHDYKDRKNKKNG